MFTQVKCFVSDMGDPSVGIFPQSWTVECPFYRENTDDDELEYFREEIAKLYSEYAEGRLVVIYDFENTDDYNTTRN